ncbi:hypothetical protein CSUI_008266 [Cystoisospora suis]|uniref:Uncharacterized protein n=1 Tax=Cystoisospora suis TaxID=483139 RepID=A0A2C6KAC0_9APIC|nr:hypothetical protein CSUI_008266 [Cystoisospora suis]
MKLAARCSTPHRVLASHRNGSCYDVLDLRTGVGRRLSHRLLRRFSPTSLTRESPSDPYQAGLFLPRNRPTARGREGRRENEKRNVAPTLVET